MQRVFRPTTMAGLLAVATASTAWVAPASAFTIVQENDLNSLLTSLLGDTTGLSGFSASSTGSPQAFGLFSADPFSLGSGVVLSTGVVTQIPGTNLGSNDLSTNLNQPGIGPVPGEGGGSANTFDLAQLDISFFASDSVSDLFFTYVFGSDEFPEFGGSQYNDRFNLLLNGVNLAKLSDGQTVSINNLVPAPSGPFHPDYIDNPVGSGSFNTKLDGFTKPLTFQGSLLQNATNTLSIQIFDVSDGIYDSAVFIKGGTVGVVKPTVPEPGLVLGLLGIAGAALVGRQRRTFTSEE